MQQKLITSLGVSWRLGLEARVQGLGSRIYGASPDTKTVKDVPDL